MTDSTYFTESDSDTESSDVTNDTRAAGPQGASADAQPAASDSQPEEGESAAESAAGSDEGDGSDAVEQADAHATTASEQAGARSPPGGGETAGSASGESDDDTPTPRERKARREDWDTIGRMFKQIMAFVFAAAVVVIIMLPAPAIAPEMVDRVWPIALAAFGYATRGEIASVIGAARGKM